MYRLNNAYDAKKLDSLPRYYSVEMAKDNGDVLHDPFGEVYNIYKLDEFIDNVKRGIEDKIRITTFGIDGPPTIAILEFDGDIIKLHYRCYSIW